MGETALDKESETAGLAVDWSLAHKWAAHEWAVCEKAGLTVGPIVLVVLFGHQGLLLWHRSRMALAWALASLRLTSSDLHLGDRFLRSHAD
jgi:hypothetical protein